ncbi:coiled coil-containing protein [Cryptosporidium canis]|uniref:Coiled coil-containing protein n=1 Tax=Cryptosporidium canis TaxID=195482 RepID=A0ABQ8P3L3_9CRYT|nr:coiled coil-containing protein [Cryptosporidium canis]
MISDSFSEIYRTVQECCPVKNPLLDHSDVLSNSADIKERKKKWKLAFCSAQECVNALDYMLENGLETLLNAQEKLRVEEALSEQEKELRARQEELGSALSEAEETLRKTIESVLLEMKALSEECRHLEQEFTKKASSIPNIIESMNSGDVKLDPQYLGKKVTAEDIHNLQSTRKSLLEDLEQLRRDEEALSREIQNLEIKWSTYRKRTQRIETEISLKKTETSHQAIQVDVHINRRLSTCSSSHPEREGDPSVEEGGAQSLEQSGTRKKRRDSVVKWIGRLSAAGSTEKEAHQGGSVGTEEGLRTSLPEKDCSAIDDKDEEVQCELQVLNLLSLVKIEQSELQETPTSAAKAPSSTLKLRVDPSSLLTSFLDPGFSYCPGLEPISADKENSAGANKSPRDLFSRGPLDFSLKVRNQCDGGKTLEEISLCSQDRDGSEKSVSAEDIALFNIFVGELNRNENIPVSSIGKLLCSTLK